MVVIRLSSQRDDIQCSHSGTFSWGLARAWEETGCSIYIVVRYSIRSSSVPFILVFFLFFFNFIVIQINDMFTYL